MEPGQFINVHLFEPTERFWGRLIRLNEAGVEIRGIETKQVEIFRYQFKGEEKSVYPQTVFFPMRRVVRIDLDEPIAGIPSIIELIQRTSGLTADDIIN